VSSRGLRFRDLLSRRVLIVGDIGVGKTALSGRLLDEAVSLGFKDYITVLDFAPTEKFEFKAKRSMKDHSDSVDSVRYLRPPVVRAPRIEGRSREEVIELAEENARVLEGYLSEFYNHPSRILFINDITLYLHSGPPERILEILSRAETSIVNAYRGERLREDLGSGISEREYKALKMVEKCMDITIELP